MTAQDPGNCVLACMLQASAACRLPLLYLARAVAAGRLLMYRAGLLRRACLVVFTRR